jgi:hypothetical protein
MLIGSESESRRLKPVDLARLAGTWLSAYVGLILCAALIPHPDVPNAFVLTALFIGLLLALLLRLLAAPLVADSVALLNCLFVAIGVAYIALSFAEMLPTGNLRPTRDDLILRHSYFVLLWIPLIAGATAFFDLTIATMARVARRAALPFLGLIIVADMSTALWLGDPDNAWEGYVSFLNPAAVTFLYVGSFFLHVAVTGRSKLALLLVTAHAALSSVTDYGVMFNTFTGTFSLGCMWAFALGAYYSPRLALFGVVGVGTALMCILVIGVVAPGLAAADLNTHWRFLVWRENLFTFFETSFLGVGFGTPYYSFSAGNIETAYMLAKTQEFAHHAQASPTDVLYYRAQHSSFVNAFYRMGLAGGMLLVAIAVALLVMVSKSANAKGSAYAWLAAAGGALFVVEASQVAMHVGLESPRYFCFFALAIGFARAVARRDERSWNA